MKVIFQLIIKRIGLSIITLLIVSAVVFFIANLLPGDAAQEMLGQSATPEAVAELREAYGLNDPPMLRYAKWLGGLLSGDAGTSLANARPVSELISSRLSQSLMLAGFTALLAVPFAMVLGIVAAMYSGSRIDKAMNIFTLSMVAVPEFLLATIFVLIFAVELNWLPSLSYISADAGLYDYFRAFAMPVATLCIVLSAQMARMTRAAVLEQLSQPYVEMALLKGSPLSRAVLRHALPNAVGPIINAVALSLSYLLGGVVIVEVIFNYPGVASLMVDAVTNRDMPLLQACAMLFCTGYLILVLIADISAILANPKLRTGG
ncbi:MAG: ABC transporter permease [Alteromonadaceae bacterium TMED7]|nr:ABC transporter permease [Alteromonadaceae bacterium]MCP3951399.1 ABC transporter permease [Desulfobacterales bacterium]MCP4947185.1 ABC transporter permease [Aestuariibacter sp.]RPH16749.1 MAG: ABC transporter permease [Alteromonadaceae bacterium TMED7]|tara:strand:+ start:58 stop:1014 length:957 start_codon:yes stop_codon:yes gene_type:complete